MLLFYLVFTAALVGSSGAVDKIYWVDRGTDKIQRSDLDGSNVEDLVTTGLSDPHGIDIDEVNAKIYWTDADTDKIQRSDLDGTNIEDLVATGLSGPRGLELDVAGGKMYWADITTNKIQRADLDGSNIEDIVASGLSNPEDVALDLTAGKVYWTDSGTNKIQRADLDGSNVEDLITLGLFTSLQDVVLDVVGWKMYWTDLLANKIQRANLDGSIIEDLVTSGLGNPQGIDLDPAAGKIYWTDWSTDKIQRANLDGSNVEDLVTSGLGNPEGIVLAGSGSTSTISGTVFEDVNYGGGVGRSYAVAASDAPSFTIERDGVRVELYDSLGNYLAYTTTALDGSYSFSRPPAVYIVRVVSSTVSSCRAGSDDTEVAVQTFRVDGDREAPGAGANKVGGEQPADIDADANSGTDTLADLQSPAGRYTQSIITVDVSGGDLSNVDFGFNHDTIVNANPSGQGSLLQFIRNANLLTDDASLDQDGLTTGEETSIFMMPGAGDALGRPADPAWNGTSFAIQPALQLAAITDPVILDGYTQSGAQPNTVAAPGLTDAVLRVEIDGTNAPPNAHGLTITSGNTTVRGLVINRFSEDGIRITLGDGNIIEGNYLGTDATGMLDRGNTGDGIEVRSAGNRIGGTTPGSRNLMSGNEDNGVDLNQAAATGNVVTGNFIGTDASGMNGLGNTLTGVVIQVNSSGNTIGGTITNGRNVISGNDNRGVTIADAGVTGNTVSGNYIGVDVTGVVALSNSTDGVCIRNTASSNTIGGTGTGEGNVISGNGASGVLITGIGTTGNVVTGNFIGTDTGSTELLGNTAEGVLIRSGTASNTIGGTASGAGNVIANNGSDGVTLAVNAAAANSIQGNSIDSNGGLGIDLRDDGHTDNDPLDGDGGPNGLQNYPVLTSVIVGGGTTTVGGTLESAPNTSFRVEFFSSASADPTGYGEGETYLDFDTVTTDGTGNATFMKVLTTAVSITDVVTATATDPTGNTSEFGPAVSPGSLEIVKRAFRMDGTPIPTGETAASGTLIQFMLYVNNPGGAVNDVSLRDALDPAFQYVNGTLKYDSSMSGCALPACTAVEEAAIYTAVSGGTEGTDEPGDDVVSCQASVMDAGDEYAANARLDINGDGVWAVLFTVRME